MKRFKQWIMYHLVCKRKLHIWENYKSTGYHSYEIEQALYCARCGLIRTENTK